MSLPRLALAAVLSCILIGCSDSTAPEVARSILIPAGAANTEGNNSNASPFSGPARRFQGVYPAIHVGVPVGARITGMRFRLNGTSSTTMQGTVTNFEVRLSTGPDAPGPLSATFADNRGSDEVIVRTGPLTVAAGDYGIGSTPNAFGPVIAFQQPFTYTGGSLLLEIGMTGISTGAAVDGVFPADGFQSAYGAANGFDTTTADLGLYDDLIVIEYRYDLP